jgi:TolB-like protein/Tfp pilus assembly protein PilF
MKGFDRPIEIHAVEVVGEEDWVTVAPREVHEGRSASAPGSLHRVRRLPRSVLLSAAVGLVVLLGLGAWWLSRGGSASPPEIPTDPLPVTGAVPIDRSIAVLPFDNLSPDPNDAFFAAGITDDILSALARIPEMDVISRTSTTQYEGTTKPVRQIAEELGVGNVLEGSVRRSGNRIRIVVQLIDAKTDRHLWTETYDRELTDVFAVQSEIAEKVAIALDAALTPEAIAGIAAKGTEDPEAYALFLQGRELLYAVSEDVEQIREQVRAAGLLFRRALDRDPEYAAAWAGLANSFVGLGWIEDRVYADSAAAMAERAVNIDPTSSQAYVALANVHSIDGRVSDGLAAAARALELEPNDPDALGFVAGSLQFVGRFDEALPLAKKLVRIEPTQPLNALTVAGIYTNLEMYEEAEIECRRVIELIPDNAFGRLCLADIEFLRGNLAAAEKELETAKMLSPMNHAVLGTSLYHEARRERFEAALKAGEQYRAGMAEGDMTDASLLVYLYQRLGELERANALYREEKRLEQFPSEADEEWWRYLEMARLATLDADHEEALRFLAGAYDRGFRDLLRLRLDPVLAMMEGDPGYARWVARIEADVARMRERVRADQREP